MWESLIPGLGPVIQKLVNLIPDLNARAAAQAEADKQIMEIVAAMDKDQTEIDKVEAGSSSLFVAGWRPFVGWVCGAAFAWQFVAQPFVAFFFTAFGHPIDKLPVLNFAEISPVLLGMLGLGGYRMMEKKWGVASK